MLTLVIRCFAVLAFLAGIIVPVLGEYAVAQESDPSESLVPLVIDLLSEPDKDLRALAFEQVRTQAPGEQATRKFAEQLPRLPAETQAGLLSALADRGDVAARPAVVTCLDSDAAEVRVAAIEALGALGNAADVPRLIERLLGGTETEQAAARKSLERLPGEEVTSSILAEMVDAPADLHVTLIEIVKGRRAIEAVPQLLKDAVSEMPVVRKAAMQALGELASAEHVAAMVPGVLKSERGAERAAAEKAVMFVCQRSEGADRAARALLDAVQRLPRADRLAMLPTLGRIGGRDGRQVVEAAIKSSDTQEHAAGVAALANWPDASAARQLVELATKDPHRGHRVAALRAAIRVAPLPDDRTDAERLELLQELMQMCERDAERQLVLQRASAVRIPDTLRFVLPYVDQPDYSHQACLTIVELAHHRNLREPNEAEFHAALDKVLATSHDPVIIDRARRYKNDQTWVRPK